MQKRNLSQRQEDFAQHYALHRSATAAFKAAGYAYQFAKRSTTHRRAIEVLQNPKVAARIDELSRRVTNRAEQVFDLTADRILQELAAIGFANLNDFVEIDGAGQPTVKLDDLERHQWAGLSEIMIEETERDYGRTTRTRLKLLDKKGALVELARLTGLVEQKGAGKDTPMDRAVAAVSAELDANLDRLLARAREEAEVEGTSASKNAWEH